MMDFVLQLVDSIRVQTSFFHHTGLCSSFHVKCLWLVKPHWENSPPKWPGVPLEYLLSTIRCAGDRISFSFLFHPSPQQQAIPLMVSSTNEDLTQLNFVERMLVTLCHRARRCSSSRHLSLKTATYHTLFFARMKALFWRLNIQLGQKLQNWHALCCSLCDFHAWVWFVKLEDERGTIFA